MRATMAALMVVVVAAGGALVAAVAAAAAAGLYSVEVLDKNAFTALRHRFDCGVSVPEEGGVGNARRLPQCNIASLAFDGRERAVDGVGEQNPLAGLDSTAFCAVASHAGAFVCDGAATSRWQSSAAATPAALVISTRCAVAAMALRLTRTAPADAEAPAADVQLTIGVSLDGSEPELVQLPAGERAATLLVVSAVLFDELRVLVPDEDGSGVCVSHVAVPCCDGCASDDAPAGGCCAQPYASGNLPSERACNADADAEPGVPCFDDLCALPVDGDMEFGMPTSEGMYSRTTATPPNTPYTATFTVAEGVTATVLALQMSTVPNNALLQPNDNDTPGLLLHNTDGCGRFRVTFSEPRSFYLTFADLDRSESVSIDFGSDLSGPGPDAGCGATSGGSRPAFAAGSGMTCTLTDGLLDCTGPSSTCSANDSGHNGQTACSVVIAVNEVESYELEFCGGSGNPGFFQYFTAAQAALLVNNDADFGADCIT